MTPNDLAVPTPETTVYPTSECFNDALDFLSEVLLANPADVAELTRSLKLVHGICLAPDGHPYAHAWVEDDATRRCIFRGILRGKEAYFGADRRDYYAEVRVQERTRYSVRRAVQLNRQHGNYGPWLPKYRVLCTTPAQEAR